jgi:hypothetical protein
VTPTANRYEEFVSAGKVDRVDHVSHPSAPNNEGRFLIDHHIENLTGIIVAILTGPEKFSAQGRLELLNRRFLKNEAPSRFGLVCHDLFSSRFPR